jgi:hypothetical protein
MFGRKKINNKNKNKKKQQESNLRKKKKEAKKRPSKTQQLDTDRINIIKNHKIEWDKIMVFSFFLHFFIYLKKIHITFCVV